MDPIDLERILQLISQLRWLLLLFKFLLDRLFAFLLSRFEGSDQASGRDSNAFNSTAKSVFFLRNLRINDVDLLFLTHSIFTIAFLLAVGWVIFD